MADRCEECPASVFWAFTTKGNSMLVNGRPTSDGKLVQVGRMRGRPVMRVLRNGERAPAGAERFDSHFVNCPGASKRRRR